MTEPLRSLDSVKLTSLLPPIVITAFARPHLLEKVLLSLENQTLRPGLIYGYVDAPRTDAQRALVLESISVFKKFNSIIPTEIVERHKNMGCDDNTVSAISEILDGHESIIYLEDDDLPNPYFYDRMCRLLNAYRDQDRVFSVNAYANYPVEITPLVTTDYFVSHRVFSWGIGFWADRWKLIEEKLKIHGYNPFGKWHDIPATIQTKYTIRNQYFIERKKGSDWCITMTLLSLYHGYVHLVPRKSMVKNIGFGEEHSWTYRGKEPEWVNANYDDSYRPNSLPQSLNILYELSSTCSKAELLDFMMASADFRLSVREMFTLASRISTAKKIIKYLREKISQKALTFL